MSKTLILSPEARAEFDSSYDFYESRQEGLGEAFADSVNAVFKRIEVSPQCHRCVVNDIRRAVVSKFPYCVYYREESDTVRVIAVFHTKRDPNIWKRRS